MQLWPIAYVSVDALRGRDLVVRSLLVLWLLRWTIRGLCCDFVSGALCPGPYEEVVQCMQSAGFLGAVLTVNSLT